MHEVQTRPLPTFHFDSHDVRIFMINDEPIWVLSDVCTCLGLLNPSDVVKRLESNEYISIDKNYTFGVGSQMLGITEAGLYRVLFRSNKPEAKAFQHWVFHDVLPMIRTTGKYEVASLEPEPLQVMAPERHIALLKQAVDFLRDLDMLTEPDKLMYRDQMNTLITGVTQPAGQQALPAPTGYQVAERVTMLGYALTRHDQAKHMAALGKAIATEYRKRHKREPITTPRYIDGAIRQVNWYPAAETAWMDTLIQSYFVTHGLLRQLTEGPEEA